MTQSPRSKPARRPVPEKLTNLINLRHPLRCRLAELIPWSELLTPQNRELLAIIRDKKPQWIAKLAELTGRASPNLTRTLGKLEAVGFVRMNLKTAVETCSAKLTVGGAWVYDVI